MVSPLNFIKNHKKQVFLLLALFFSAFGLFFTGAEIVYGTVCDIGTYPGRPNVCSTIGGCFCAPGALVTGNCWEDIGECGGVEDDGSYDVNKQAYIGVWGIENANQCNPQQGGELYMKVLGGCPPSQPTGTYRCFGGDGGFRQQLWDITGCSGGGCIIDQAWVDEPCTAGQICTGAGQCTQACSNNADCTASCPTPTCIPPNTLRTTACACVGGLCQQTPTDDDCTDNYPPPDPPEYRCNGNIVESKTVTGVCQGSPGNCAPQNTWTPVRDCFGVDIPTGNCKCSAQGVKCEYKETYCNSSEVTTAGACSERKFWKLDQACDGSCTPTGNVRCGSAPDKAGCIPLPGNTTCFPTNSGIEAEYRCKTCGCDAQQKNACYQQCDQQRNGIPGQPGCVSDYCKLHPTEVFPTNCAQQIQQCDDAYKTCKAGCDANCAQQAQTNPQCNETLEWRPQFSCGPGSTTTVTDGNCTYTSTYPGTCEIATNGGPVCADVQFSVNCGPWPPPPPGQCTPNDKRVCPGGGCQTCNASGSWGPCGSCDIPGPGFHTVCSWLNQCLLVQGSGPNQCGSNNDCSNLGAACTTDGKCISTIGGGNQCQFSSDCANTTHTECTAQQQCVVVSGAGTPECTNNFDCQSNTHTECDFANQICKVVSGPGDNECSSDLNCSEIILCDPAVDPLCQPKCNLNKRCIPTFEPGAPCGSDADCSVGEVYNTCNASNQCVTVTGSGSDQCTSECCTPGSTRACPGGGTQTCNANSQWDPCPEWRNECTTQKQCVAVTGAGTDQCQNSPYCLKNTHNECDDLKRCVVVDGVGPDRCGSSFDCQAPNNEYAECNPLSKQCETKYGWGVTTCTGNSDCSPPPPPPTDCTSQPCHLECRDDACVQIAGSGIDSCSAGSGECTAKHTECRNNACVVVDGAGLDDCYNDSQCVFQHTECVGETCQAVSGAGDNLCQSTADCRPPDSCANPPCYTKCSNYSCVSVSGSQPNECQNNSECIETNKHLECRNEACVLVDGDGPNRCSNDNECTIVECTTQPCHTECNAQNQCVAVSGAGANACDTSNKCKINDEHLECVNNSCQIIQGAGIDECSNSNQCTSPQPCPTWPNCRSVCQNFACVSVPGSGQNDCGNTSECIVPPPPEGRAKCVNQSCQFVAESGENLCSTSEQCVEETHTECVNQACQTVAGAGANACTSNSQCQPPTTCANPPCYTECQNFACVSVSGTQPNQCANTSECLIPPPPQGRAKCVNQSCNWVAEDPALGNECQANSECLVSNEAPYADGLNAVSGSPCTGIQGVGIAYFQWYYRDAEGDNESEFTLEVDDNSNFASPEFKTTIKNLSYPPGTLNQQLVTFALNPAQGSNILKYGVPYYWHVRVGARYGNNSFQLSDWKVAPSTFTMTGHPGPWVEFTFDPSAPDPGQSVYFRDISMCYDGPTPAPCKADGSNSYTWDFGDGQTSNTVGDFPNKVYDAVGRYNASLQVSDGSISCIAQHTVPVTIKGSSRGLPNWREISPFR